MKHLILATTLLVSFNAQADPPPPVGHVTSATIDALRVGKDGLAVVIFSNYVWAEGGSCRSAGQEYTLGFDSKTIAGQSLLQSILDAKANSFTLSGEGTGQCMLIDGGSVETVNYLVLR